MARAVHGRRRLSRDRRDPHLLLNAATDSREQTPQQAPSSRERCSPHDARARRHAVSGAAAGRRGHARGSGFRRARQCRRSGAPGEGQPADDRPLLPRIGFCGLARIQAAPGAEPRRRDIDPASRGRARRQHADRDAQGLAGRGERACQPRAAYLAGGYRARRHADRESAAGRLLRRRQHVDVHGERRAGALFPARAGLELSISTRICSSSRRRR